VQHGSRSTKAGAAGLSALVALPVAWLTGCSLGGDMIAGMDSEVETAPSPHGASAAQPPGPGIPTATSPKATSNALVVTPHQQSYLDALHAAGVAPSSDLSALSIGSSVCQARAARQTEEAVWDFVVPLVRNDVRGYHDGGDGVPTPSANDLDSVTADYIRIATDRLC
jgi:hypothetical protein